MFSKSGFNKNWRLSYILNVTHEKHFCAFMEAPFLATKDFIYQEIPMSIHMWHIRIWGVSTFDTILHVCFPYISVYFY